MDMSLTDQNVIVAVAGTINITIKNQDDVDEFNENADSILKEFSENRTLTVPRDSTLTGAPRIVAEGNGTYGFVNASGDADGGTGLSFPFTIRVDSDNYWNIGSVQN